MKLSELTPLQWIGIIILFNGTLIGGSSYLQDLLLGTVIVKAVIAVASLGNMFLGGLVTMFSSQGSMVRSVAAMPGVEKIAVNGLANQTLAQIATSTAQDSAKVEATPAAQAAVTQIARASAVLAAIILGGLIMMGGTAQAQGQASTSRAKIGCDLLNLKPGCKSAKAQDDIKNLNDAMSKPLQDFATFVQGDVAGAINLASQIPGLQDGNGQACFRTLQNAGAIITTLQATVKKGGSVGVATAYEALRLLHMNMINTCNNKACTQIFSEATNVLAAAAPMKAQIPSLTQLCSQIPSIAIEPVTADATAAPAAPAPADIAPAPAMPAAKP